MSNKDANAIVKYYEGRTQEISQHVVNILRNSPISLMKAPSSRGYMQPSERKEIAKRIIQEGNMNWVRHTHKLQEYLSADYLRQEILKVFDKSPWIVETQKDALHQIFSNDFFEKEIQEHGNFSSEAIFQLFLLFNAHKEIESYHEDIQKILGEKIKSAPSIDANFFGEREPGFACGGMEQNYLEASKNGEGICLVNGSLFAKFFHRKGEAKKVSYLPAKTYKTNNGYVLWENYFYAPSDQQHQLVIDAISNNEKQIYIPNITIKSVRPANNLTSEMIRKMLQDRYNGSIK